jgi:signal transduction histidine kinase
MSPTDEVAAAASPVVRPAMRPAAVAAAMAGTYLVLAAAYILVSSTFASEVSGSVEDLKRVEILKGLAFVAGSALLLFVVNLTTLRTIQRHEARTRRMERALRNAESSVLAGTFARTIAHDINNALGAATMNLELLQTYLTADPPRRALADEVAQALARITDWNRRFFEIGGRQLLDDARPLDLCAIINGAVELGRHHRKLRLAQVDVALPDDAAYTGIASIIQRAVLNLVLNAADAAGARARILVSLTEVAGGQWSITVEDNGPGIPVGMRAEVLEPFFTTKPDGSGLGLASVVACARFHGGDVRIDDSRLGGARFTLTLTTIPERKDAPGTDPGAS